MPTQPFIPRATGGGPQYPDPFELAKFIPNINASMPGIRGVASGVNRFQQGELLSQVEKLFPGLQPSVDQAGDNILSMLKGIVPADVQRQLQGNTAARALSQGVPGSQFAGNEFGEALGLTSLDLQGRGQQELLGLTGGIRQNLTAPLYDVAQDIPDLGDLYNVYSSQEVANAGERRREDDLALMEKYYRTLAATGGRGGGAPSYTGGGGSGGIRPPSGPPNTAFQGYPNYTGDTHGTGTPGSAPWSFNPAGSDWVNAGNMLPLYPGGPTPGGSDWMSSDYGPAVDLSGLFKPPQPFGPMTPNYAQGPMGGGTNFYDFSTPGVSDFGGQMPWDYIPGMGGDSGFDMGFPEFNFDFAGDFGG